VCLQHFCKATTFFEEGLGGSAGCEEEVNLGREGKRGSHGLGGAENSRAADAIRSSGVGVGGFSRGLSLRVLQFHALHLPRGRGGDVSGDRSELAVPQSPSVYVVGACVR
jgi:hypothetical protein